MNLTDKQCDEFRRMPGSFNDMVRAIYAAGRKAGLEEALSALPQSGVGHYIYEKALTDCAAAIRAIV